MSIDTGDLVFHIPSRETWIVACVDGNYLSWCGWPPGEARLSDCTLVRKATPEQREKLLNDLASMYEDDHRKRHAIRRLAETPEPPKEGE